ncbi:MAG TPA: diaminopimelate decarboxylase, partial [Patescibacteria group bacterium]|nr:diaminopimelate decarboxylase [Patescibacteria group bacterium]
IGGVSAESLVKKYGSSLYVYDAAILKRQLRLLIDNITYPRTEFYYACKHNTNVEIMKLLKKAGAKLEAVSPAEVLVAFEAGYKPEEIIYTASYTTKEELQFVIENKIMINLDSLTQIKRFGEIKPGGNISIRINQGIGGGHHEHNITGGPDSKFGVDLSEINEAKKLAKKYRLKIVGIHQHIGSGILDEPLFIKATKTLLKTAEQFDDLDFIDFGGGFGLSYNESQKPLDMHMLGKRLTKELEQFVTQYGKQVRFLFEPGRFLVGESGVLLGTVTEIKKTPYHTFVGIDSGMNQLVRPIMYGSYHDIVNASHVSGNKESVWIVGNICESGDVLGRDRLITKCKEGDIIAIFNAGAMGYSMSSLYNGRPQPAEVLVEGDTSRVIREQHDLSILTKKKKIR